MAIYYIDPHTTTNGTGTWASPWSLNVNTRTGLTSGDEIRIKGVALTSLLTATVYTASYTAHNQMTITAGGGLGADFALGDIVYFPTYDVFAKVSVSSANVLTFNGSTATPWYNTSSGQTSITVRKVDKTTYPASALSNAFYFTDLSEINSITMSDCWTSATTRVTDGSVKTLIHTSFTSSAVNLYLNVSSSTTASGYTYNFNNTHILGPNSGSGNVTFRSNASNVTATIKQLVLNGTSGALNIGSTFIRPANVTLTINDLSGYYGFCFSACACDGLTVNVENLATYQCDTILGSTATALSNCENVTLTVNGTIVGYTQSNAAIVYYIQFGQKNLQLTLNGVTDIFTSGTTSSILNGQSGGQIEVIFGAGYTLYRNRRTATTTSATYGVLITSPTLNIYLPNYVKPASWSAPATIYAFGTTALGNTNLLQTPFVNKPQIISISVPTALTTTQLNTVACLPGSFNNLIVARDGSSPVEVLSTNGFNSTPSSAQNFPQVTTDATMYQTTGPSLKSYLPTYNNSYFVRTRAIKTIKIPVVASTAYTITGYIRTNDTAYVNGDCFVSAEFDGVQLDVQTMTTSCINAWEQFTLTFTASKTGEVNLVWAMLFANGAKSIWLSDLTIS